MAANCSPSAKFEKYTCFPVEALALMTAEVNRTSGSNMPVRVNKLTLWKNLQLALQHMCADNEACWSDQLSMQQEHVKSRAPLQWVQNQQKHLTTSQVHDVLKQYTTSKFWFLGVYPLNFHDHTKWGKCIGDMLCSLDLKRLRNHGCTCFAFVFNTHKNGMPGQHWLAVYCGMDPNNPNYGVFFYDSYGGAWPPSVGQYMSKLEAAMADANFRRHRNTYVHQRKSGECGMFCIEWIMNMVRGVPFDEYVKNKAITDDYMTERRNVYFR